MIGLLQPLLVLPPSLTSWLLSFAAPPHKLTHPKPSTITPKDQLKLTPAEKSHFTVHKQPAPQQQAQPQNLGEKLGCRQLIITGPAGAGSGRAVRAVPRGPVPSPVPARLQTRGQHTRRRRALVPPPSTQLNSRLCLLYLPVFALPDCICLDMCVIVFVKFYIEL